MFPATLLTTFMALGPPVDGTEREFDARLDSAEIVGGDDVQMLAYDAEGDVIGMIALWVDRRGRIHLSSDYADGYADVVVVGEQATVEATLPPAVSRKRADLVLAKIVSGSSTTARSPLVCAATIAGAVGLCAVSGGLVILTCPAGVILAVCACAPVLHIEVTGCEG